MLGRGSRRAAPGVRLPAWGGGQRTGEPRGRAARVAGGRRDRAAEAGRGSGPVTLGNCLCAEAPVLWKR